MRVRVPLLALALLLPSSGVLAKSGEPSIDQAFAEADWNDDGLIDRREYFQALVYRSFRLDADDDGQLSPWRSWRVWIPRTSKPPTGTATPRSTSTSTSTPVGSTSTRQTRTRTDF